MKDFLYYNALFDLYGGLLTKKEQISFHDYYQEDFSFSEIAELKGISRSAVAKTIKTVLDKLNYYEDKLQIYKRNQLLQDVLELKKEKEIKEAIERVLLL